MRVWILSLLFCASAALAIEPGTLMPVTIESSGRMYRVTEVITSTEAATVTYRVMAGWPGAATPCPVQLLWATQGPVSRSHVNRVTVIERATGRKLVENYSSTWTARYAGMNIWVWLVPGREYDVVLEPPPAIRKTTRILGVGLWGYWVEKWKLALGAAMHGDGHTAEFR